MKKDIHPALQEQLDKRREKSEATHREWTGARARLPTQLHRRSKEYEFLIPVEVVGARYVFGRTDVLVRPTVGEGESWVRADSLKDVRFP